MDKQSINEIFKDALSDPELASVINIDDLIIAIEDDKNEHLDNKTLDNIAEDKYKKLKKLNLEKEELKDMFSKLSEYRYIDEIHQLHIGKHVRWIRTHDVKNSTINNGKYNLTSGGIVVEIKFLDTGTHVMVLTKNPKKRCIQYIFDNCITFQKMSTDEQLILAAYEYIQKT